MLGICFYFTRWIGCISVLCIIIGALTGTWVSFGARKFEIEFEDLASLEKDKMTPVIRLIYIAVASLIFALLGICKYNGKYLLELTGNACGDNYYYGIKKDGSVGLVHKFIWKGDAMEGDWYMDGKKVSGNMYGTYYKKYHANATWYSFAQSSNNSLIRKELSNTKKKLGM